MEKIRRARHIIHHVQALDEKWGKPGDPRKEGSDKTSRIISDEVRWHARVTPEHEIGPDGEPWDLIEVTAHGQHRMTAAFREDEIDLRLFLPGPWEPVFNLPNPTDLTPLLPNQGTKFEMHRSDPAWRHHPGA